MTLAERFQQQGMQQGELRQARESAKRLLRMGMAWENIAQVTDLSIEEIQKLVGA